MAILPHRPPIKPTVLTTSVNVVSEHLVYWRLVAGSEHLAICCVLPGSTRTGSASANLNRHTTGGSAWRVLGSYVFSRLSSANPGTAIAQTSPASSGDPPTTGATDRCRKVS